MSKQKIKIIIPKGVSTNIDNGLVELTRQLRLKTRKEGGFGLGGQDGYGIEYENKIFSMMPYCWCQENNCKWCNENAPNFFYKPTGYKITWYKYIGRGQEQKGKLPKNWLEKCIKSLWKKGDCYYEFDINRRDISESLICLHFDVTNPKTFIEIEFSSYWSNDVYYWNLDEIMRDIFIEKNNFNKIIELDKKYPALREKIRLDAIDNCKDRIKWFKMRVKSLTLKT